jgi:hypothetical protein
MKNFIIEIPDLEEKINYSIKLRPSVKKALTDLSRKTKIPHENIDKAGIWYIQKEYEKIIKNPPKEINQQIKTNKKIIINPFPKLVKRNKKAKL